GAARGVRHELDPPDADGAVHRPAGRPDLRAAVAAVAEADDRLRVPGLLQRRPAGHQPAGGGEPVARRGVVARLVHAGAVVFLSCLPFPARPGSLAGSAPPKTARSPERPMTRYRWARAGDVNAFFGLMLDNVAVMIILFTAVTSLEPIDQQLKEGLVRFT